MKRVTTVLFLSILLLGGYASAGAGRKGPGPGPGPGPDAQEGPWARECSLSDMLRDLPPEPLSAREAAGLAFSREEEKLARDVYLSLHETWQLKVFLKIARSEREHMRAVRVLLHKYGLTDPIGANGIGVFTDPALQEAYDLLVAQGNLSLNEALKVGVYVEEMDIFDLLGLIAKTNNRDIGALYQNLRMRSRNHLRAFHRQLERRGFVYGPPAFLSEETFQGIVETSPEGGLVDQEGEWLCGGRRADRYD